MKYYKIRIDSLAGRREWKGEEALKIRYLPNNESNLTSKELPDFEPLFAKMYISGDLTDVVHKALTDGTGFTISKRLKNILNEFNLYNFRFYPLGKAFSYEKDIPLNNEYFWLQLVVSPFLDWINYANSEFELMDTSSTIPKKIKSLSINNKNDLKTAISNTRNNGYLTEKDEDVYYKKMIFNSIFSKLNLDLFYFFDISDNLFSYPIISERLKTRLEKEKVTGFEMKKVNIQTYV